MRRQIGKRPDYRPNKRRYTKSQRGAFIKRKVKRELIRQGLIQDPATALPKFAWDWEIGETAGEATGTVYANTRSEARARIKRELGISKNKRLPQYVFIEKRIYADLPESTPSA